MKNIILTNNIATNMKNNNTNELTKSQLIDLVLNQNAKIKHLEQHVKNLGSIFVSGQPSSNHDNRPQYLYRLLILINFDLSCSICVIRARN